MDDRAGDDDAARELCRRAERLDELADTAELMGDDHTTATLRRQAAQHRDEALARLDRRNDTRG